MVLGRWFCAAVGALLLPYAAIDEIFILRTRTTTAKKKIEKNNGKELLKRKCYRATINLIPPQLHGGYIKKKKHQNKVELDSVLPPIHFHSIRIELTTHFYQPFRSFLIHKLRHSGYNCVDWTESSNSINAWSDWPRWNRVGIIQVEWIATDVNHPMSAELRSRNQTLRCCQSIKRGNSILGK